MLLQIPEVYRQQLRTVEKCRYIIAVLIRIAALIQLRLADKGAVQSANASG